MQRRMEFSLALVFYVFAGCTVAGPIFQHATKDNRHSGVVRNDRFCFDTGSNFLQTANTQSTNAISEQSSKDQYFNAIDQDQSGGVSLKEFQSWMRYAFDRIDTNKNDVIDADEALVPRMKGVTRAKHQANIAKQFNRQDANRDGALSKAELIAPPR
jgi:hypothetical protein